MTDCGTMPHADWLDIQSGRCFFYPGRDCPGWQPGGACGRIGIKIPADAVDD